MAYRYLPDEQSNPVLSGLMSAFTVASQMKQQAREQENQRIQQAHEARMSNAEDLRNRLMLLQSGARPLNPDGTVDTTTVTPGAVTPSAMDSLPAMFSQAAPTTSTTPKTPDPGRVFNVGGVRYAYPTDQERAQLEQAVEAQKQQQQLDLEEGKAKIKDKYTAKLPVTLNGQTTQLPANEAATIINNQNTQTSEDKRQASSQTFQGAQNDLNRANARNINASTQAGEMARTQFVQGQENARNDKRLTTGPDGKPMTAGQQAVDFRVESKNLSNIQDQLRATHQQRTDAGLAMATEDGQDFTDPITNKKRTMNALEKQRLKNFIDNDSMQRVNELNGKADALQKRMGWGKYAQPQNANPPATPAPAVAGKTTRYTVGQTVYYQGKPHTFKGYDNQGNARLLPQ